jgi:lipopolysaccharide export system permease protein
MSGLLDRYVLRETVQAWLVVTVVLLLILVTNQFATVVGDAAADKLPRDAIYRVMGLTSVQYLTILVPVGLFLAIMLALARLYHDSEMAAMMACGVGPTDLYRPILLLAGVLAVLVGVLAIVVSPAAVREVQMVAEEAKRAATLGLLEPGRFISFNNGEAVLYAEAVTPDGHLQRVFVQRRVGPRTEVIIADEAWARTAPGNEARVLTFARGRRYEGVPGQPQFRVIEFAEHGIPYALQPRAGGTLPPEARSSLALYQSGTADDLAELHWRIGVPLTLFVLAVIAVPLARTEPRKGRFSGLAPAVLLYVIYANLLGAGKGWLERGQLPPWAGLWWVHALFLAFAGGMLAVQQGWWTRLRLRRQRR